MTEHCPKCGYQVLPGTSFCYACGATFEIVKEINNTTEAVVTAPVIQMPISASPGNSFPGIYWLLPIFCGIIGGIIGAILAQDIHKASGKNLIIVGIVITGLCAFIGVLIYNSMTRF